MRDDLQTPDSIIRELVQIRSEATRGIDAQFAAEQKLARAVIDAETAEAKALLMASGSVAERQAIAKVETEALRFAESIARAEYNRVKTKLKLLEQSQMSVQTQARLVELMYRSAGLGEK